MSSSIKHTQSSKSSSSFSSPSFDENRWVTQIRRTLEEELEDESETPVSIFNVPKILMATDPDSYTPQEVAIGPYHYQRPELYEMERYKLAAAKRTQKSLQADHKLQDIVKQFTKHEERIRGCYNKYLDLSDETLAWMMVIDGSFLLEFLQIYATKHDEVMNLRRLSSRMSHLLDYTGQTSAHNSILRDLVMLENQIPLFVLRKMLEFQFPTLDAANDMLSSMLLGLCQEWSPFKNIEETLPNILLSDCAHLLDYLYEMVTPEIELGSREDVIEVVVDAEGKKDNKGCLSSFGSSKHVKQLFSVIWKILTNIHKGPIARFLKSVIFSKPMKVFFKLPWAILSNLPGIRVLKAPVEMFFTQDKDKDNENSSSNNDNKNINKPPLIEEITIPSVTELSESGVVFSPTNGNISTVAFDPKTSTLYLPAVTLDVNTEPVLRNLVAYEASKASGPLIFTRYTELMNGIIDTDEDVRLLREKGIILNRLKSDQEAAEVWNGMSKSIRLTKVPFLDKAIEEVNKYYDGRWKVKFRKFMKRYVFGSWQILTFLAAVLMLLLMGLQAFCSVYTCSRIVNQVGNAKV